MFNPLFKSFEQCTLKSVGSINTKMFENVRDYLSTSSLQMKSSDSIPTSIVIAADTDQNVHFRQLATFLEGKRCIDGRKEWIIVRLCYNDPDESRTPAAIWHKVLVSMCDFFLGDASNEDCEGNDAEVSDTENSGNESDHTDAMDIENIVPESSKNDDNGIVTKTKSYRLRQSTKMKKIILEMDEESMKVMRRDREEWRWIRDVAGGYGGMPHELLQHWLIRHGEKLLSRAKHLKSCTNIVLQLEGVEHFRSETLKDLVRTCILLKRHVKRSGLSKALRFSFCMGASTEAGVNFVIRPWRSSLLLRTFWKAKPTEILASVERPLISEPMHPLMISP